MECAVVSNKQVSVVRQSIHDCVVCIRVAPAQCQCVERRSSGVALHWKGICRRSVPSLSLSSAQSVADFSPGRCLGLSAVCSGLLSMQLWFTGSVWDETMTSRWLRTSRQASVPDEGRFCVLDDYQRSVCVAIDRRMQCSTSVQ